jgi:hypothetical protein
MLGYIFRESTFGKDLQYRSEQAIQIMLFTFFILVDFLFGKDPFPTRMWSLFWEFSNSTRIFNELQYNLQVWQEFINVSESFSYKDSLFILVTQGKKGLWYLMTS